MRKYGLIGYPLSYSFSPGYFKAKFKREKIRETSYKIYPLEEVKEFKSLIKDHELIGLNVTIPYKEKILRYLDSIEDSAKTIGAVNTLKREGDTWKGFNTDVYGFRKSLKSFIGRKKVSAALVLGTGGASKAVCYVLEQLNIETQLVSRRRSKTAISYKDLDVHVLKDHRLIINTTPLGTSPNLDQVAPLDFDQISKKHLLYDLVYNPEKTLFLKRGEAQGCAIKNGSEMLELQAEESWRIWNNNKI